MPGTATDFEQLMQRVKAGCPEATREVCERYGKYVRQAIRFVMDRRLRRLYSERDFEQSVWASFFKGLPGRAPFASPAQLIRFLATLARNRVIDEVRHRRTAKHDLNREQSLDRPCGPDSEGGCLADRVAGREATPSTGPRLKELLESLQSDLSPLDRQILELLGQGHTHAQVEATTGVHPKKIQRLLLDRKLKLRRELRRAGYTHDEIETYLGLKRA
jgi:DNA-directed RNA polymerase specialized sigma24 family protein